MEELSPGVSTPSRKPVLTGSARKIKDNAADWHNFILKWERLNDDGYTIANQIVNLTLSKASVKETDITIECDDTSVSHQPAYTAGPNKELEDKCTDLLAILDKMTHLASKMERLSATTKGVCDLQKFQQGASEAATTLFQTWPTSHFDEVSSKILESYKQELALKETIVQEIAHTSNSDLSMVYLSCWLYQPYIGDSTKLLLESMLLETGHRPL
ncbi:cyclin-dependent kinase 2-interacting protein [Megalops cyprinoides]|uniref:cyclin-dependent kinase 2-interacting protein n=1 Tax=Megalops cyprinoides TaxID=118141 RepID=UPI001863D250|nr:cyclin-dependent kinase 2-interacting protein [Megalops cyprinoides]